MNTNNFKGDLKLRHQNSLTSSETDRKTFSSSSMSEDDSSDFFFDTHDYSFDFFTREHAQCVCGSQLLGDQGLIIVDKLPCDFRFCCLPWFDNQLAQCLLMPQFVKAFTKAELNAIRKRLSPRNRYVFDLACFPEYDPSLFFSPFAVRMLMVARKEKIYFAFLEQDLTQNVVLPHEVIFHFVLEYYRCNLPPKPKLGILSHSICETPAPKRLNAIKRTFTFQVASRARGLVLVNCNVDAYKWRKSLRLNDVISLLFKFMQGKGFNYVDIDRMSNYANVHATSLLALSVGKIISFPNVYVGPLKIDFDLRSIKCFDLPLFTWVLSEKYGHIPSRIFRARKSDVVAQIGGLEANITIAYINWSRSHCAKRSYWQRTKNFYADCWSAFCDFIGCGEMGYDASLYARFTIMEHVKAIFNKIFDQICDVVGFVASSVVKLAKVFAGWCQVFFEFIRHISVKGINYLARLFGKEDKQIIDKDDGKPVVQSLEDIGDVIGEIFAIAVSLIPAFAHGKGTGDSLKQFFKDVNPIMRGASTLKETKLVQKMTSFFVFGDPNDEPAGIVDRSKQVRRELADLHKMCEGTMDTAATVVVGERILSLTRELEQIRLDLAACNYTNAQMNAINTTLKSLDQTIINIKRLYAQKGKRPRPVVIFLKGAGGVGKTEQAERYTRDILTYIKKHYPNHPYAKLPTEKCDHAFDCTSSREYFEGFGDVFGVRMEELYTSSNRDINLEWSRRLFSWADTRPTELNMAFEAKGTNFFMAKVIIATTNANHEIAVQDPLAYMRRIDFDFTVERSKTTVVQKLMDKGIKDEVLLDQALSIPPALETRYIASDELLQFYANHDHLLDHELFVESDYFTTVRQVAELVIKRSGEASVCDSDYSDLFAQSLYQVGKGIIGICAMPFRAWNSFVHMATPKAFRQGYRWFGGPSKSVRQKYNNFDTIKDIKQYIQTEPPFDDDEADFYCRLIHCVMLLCHNEDDEYKKQSELALRVMIMGDFGYPVPPSSGSVSGVCFAAVLYAYYRHPHLWVSAHHVAEYMAYYEMGNETSHEFFARLDVFIDNLYMCNCIDAISYQTFLERKEGSAQRLATYLEEVDKRKEKEIDLGIKLFLSAFTVSTIAIGLVQFMRRASPSYVQSDDARLPQTKKDANLANMSNLFSNAVKLQGGSPLSQLAGKVANQTWFVTDENNAYGSCVFVSNCIIVVNKHVWNVSNTHVRLFNPVLEGPNGKDRGVAIIWAKKDCDILYDPPERDIYYIKTPFVRAMKKLPLMPRKELDNFSSANSALYYMFTQERIAGGEVVGNVGWTTVGRLSRPANAELIKGLPLEHQQDLLHCINQENAAGHCGRPYLITHKNINYVAMVHVAGSTTKFSSYGVPLYEEDFRFFEKAHPIVQSMNNEFSCIKPFEELDDLLFSSSVHTKATNKTVFVPTDLKGPIGEPPKIPAKLNDEAYEKAKAKAIPFKQCVVLPSYTYSLLREKGLDFLNRKASNLVDDYDCRGCRFLTVEESIYGDGKDIDSFDFSTADGMILKHHNVTKNDIREKNEKASFIIDYIGKLWLMICSGQFIYQTAAEALKDELRDHERVKACKTRIFFVHDFVFNVLLKMALGQLVHKRGARLGHHSEACGINPGSTIWKMWFNMFKGYDYVVCGDVSGNDYMHSPAIVETLIRYVGQFYTGFGVDKSVTNVITWSIMGLITAIRFNKGKGEYQGHGNTSGNYLTTFVNTLQLILIKMSCFWYCAIENGEDPEQCMDHLQMIVYSDDNISASPYSWWTIFAFRDWAWKLFRATITATDKSDNITNMTIYEADFLSRRFVPHERNPEIICAPLSMDSLLAQLFYVRKCSNGKNIQAHISKQLEQNCGNVKRELVHYPYSQACDIITRINESLISSGYTFIIPPFENEDDHYKQYLQRL